MMRPLKRVTASLRREPTITGKAQQSEVNEICPLCRRTSNAPRLSIPDVLLNSVCVVVLLAILVPAVWFAEDWLERAGQRAVDRMIWREPLESWSQ
jgi:hypothetical protein